MRHSPSIVQHLTVERVQDEFTDRMLAAVRGVPRGTRTAAEINTAKHIQQGILEVDDRRTVAMAFQAKRGGNENAVIDALYYLIAALKSDRQPSSTHPITLHLQEQAKQREADAMQELVISGRASNSELGECATRLRAHRDAIDAALASVDYEIGKRATGSGRAA